MSNTFKRTLALATSGALILIIGFLIGTSVFSSAASNAMAEVLQAQTAPALSITEQTFADVYRNVSPSVVAISVVAQRDGATLAGSGSGFVIDQQGHILTNDHVVQGATSIEVNFIDGTIVRADVVGEDPDSDLAVIQVDVPASELVPVIFGSVDDLVVGQTVLAIGSPFGERWTLTSGIVSAKDRSIRGLSQGGFSIGSVIQTDASINPGNSGGPLLNLAGQVVGVNSQIATESGSNSGIGYAIPSDLAARVAQEIITNGRVEYSYIGISGGDVRLSEIESLSLPNNLTGIVVSQAVPSGPAAAAGLQSAQVSQDQTRYVSADIITAINGEPLSGIDELISYLAKYTRPGEAVTLTVYRNGQQVQLTVTLQQRPN